MIGEIDSLGTDRLLSSDLDALCDYFEQKYQFEPPRMLKDDAEADQREVGVDVSRDPLRDIRDRSRPFEIKGTSVSLFVPFKGDATLFMYQPSSFTSSNPHGVVREGELVLTEVTVNHNAEQVKAGLQRTLGEVVMYLSWVEKDIEKFNAGLRAQARAYIECRRKKLQADQTLVASLGFRLREREGAPRTFAVPTVRKKVVPRLPPKEDPSRDPALDMDNYEHILGVISNMVAVMERSPHAFRGMKEEDLRQHFLVQLNGQYEGQATGETFNFEGKTDILIRVEGRNIFIAECKFWHGPQSFSEAIDQLLGYLSWRDTKAALLVFNRGGNLTATLSKIPQLVRGHPSFVREWINVGETSFRFTLSHRDDPARELVLTVMVFEVPE
jgi:hypothetical protein